MHNTIWAIVTCFLLAAIVSFYYIVIQPAQHEKAKRRRRSTKEEIDNLFDQVDPFSATESAGLDNYQVSNN